LGGVVAVTDVFLQCVAYEELQLIVKIGHAAKIEKKKGLAFRARPARSYCVWNLSSCKNCLSPFCLMKRVVR
jgi:hypothetical protein